MKSCPKCGRVYDDISLNFCLEDGEWLVDPEAEGESTRVLPGPQETVEAVTKQQITKTGETEILPTGTGQDPAVKTAGGSPAFKVIGAAVGLAVVFAAGYGLYRWYSGLSAESDPIPEIETERLTGDGKVVEASISSDGKFIAYLEIKDDKSSLRVRQIETTSTVEILKEGDFEVINNVVFSPDGNFVYFAAIGSDRKMSIYKVPTLGGTPLALPVASMSFSLSPDGSKLAFYEEDADSTETYISVARSDGTEPKKIISKAGSSWIEAPTAWSPDGSKLLFVEGDDRREGESELSLAVFSFENNSAKALGNSRWERIDVKGFAWDPSGEFMYISGEQSGSYTRQLWRVTYPEGDVVRLTRNQSSYRGLSITADGSRLLTTEEQFRTGVWVSPDTDPMNAVEVFPGRGDTWGLSWTPEGKIVYISDQSGAPEVWIMDADGSGQKQLTNDRLYKMEPDVSPDGRSVVYFCTVDGFQLYLVPIGGGAPTRIETEQVGPSNPVFAKDGAKIAFSAWTGGKQSLYSVPLEKGAAKRLTDYPSTEPSYSPDGSKIACFYVPDGTRYFSLAIIPADGGAPIETFEVPTSTETARGLSWTPDGQKVTYIVKDGEKADLWAQPVGGGDPLRLSDFSRPWIMRRAYSADGKQIALTRGEGIYNALMLKIRQ